jgi:hypothetical protein
MEIMYEGKTYSKQLTTPEECQGTLNQAQASLLRGQPRQNSPNLKSYIKSVYNQKLSKINRFDSSCTGDIEKPKSNSCHPYRLSTSDNMQLNFCRRNIFFA